MAFRLPGQNKFKPNKARPRPPGPSQPAKPPTKDVTTTLSQPGPSLADERSPHALAADQIGDGSLSQMPDLTQGQTQLTQDTVIATPRQKESTAAVFDSQDGPSMQSTHITSPQSKIVPPSTEVQTPQPNTIPSIRPVQSRGHPSPSAAHVERGNAALSEKDKSPPYTGPPSHPGQTRPSPAPRGFGNRMSGSPALGMRPRSMTPSLQLGQRSAGPSALLKAAAAQAEMGFNVRPSPGRIPPKKSQSARSGSARLESAPPESIPDLISPVVPREDTAHVTLAPEEQAPPATEKPVEADTKESPGQDHVIETDEGAGPALDDNSKQTVEPEGVPAVEEGKDLQEMSRDPVAEVPMSNITTPQTPLKRPEPPTVSEPIISPIVAPEMAGPSNLTPSRRFASREEMMARVQAKVLGKKMDRPSVNRENSWTFGPMRTEGRSSPPRQMGISSVLESAERANPRNVQDAVSTSVILPARIPTPPVEPHQASDEHVPLPEAADASNPDISMDFDGHDDQSFSVDGDDTSQTGSHLDAAMESPSWPPAILMGENARPSTLAGMASSPEPQASSPPNLIEQAARRRHQTPLFDPASPGRSSTNSPSSEYDDPDATDTDGSDVTEKAAPRRSNKTVEKVAVKQKSKQKTKKGDTTTKKKAKPKKQVVATEESTDEEIVTDDGEGDLDDQDSDVGETKTKAKKRKSVNGGHVRSKNKKPKQKTLQLSQAALTDLSGGDRVGAEDIDISTLTMADLALNINTGLISSRGVLLDDFVRATKKQAAEQLPMRRWTRWEKEQIYRRHQRRQANQRRATRRQEAIDQGSNPDDEVSADEEDSEEEFEIVQDRFTPPPEDEQVERLQPLSLVPQEDVQGEEEDEAADDAIYDQIGEEEEDIDENNMDVNFDDVQDQTAHDTQEQDGEEDDPYANLVEDADYEAAADDIYDDVYGDATQNYLDEREMARDEHRRRQEDVEAIQEDDDTKMINSKTYSKVRKVERWTKTETEFFFDTALPEAGENPFMLQGYFPGRTQQQLKRKMNKEYKLNKERYLRALDNKRKVDTVYLEKAAGFNNEKDYTEEKAWLKQLKEETDRLKTGDAALPDDHGLEAFGEEKEDGEEKYDEGEKEDHIEYDFGDQVDDVDYDNYEMDGNETFEADDGYDPLTES